MKSFDDILLEAHLNTIQDIDFQGREHGTNMRPAYLDGSLNLVQQELAQIEITPLWLVDMLAKHPEFLTAKTSDLDVQEALKDMIDYFMLSKIEALAEPYIDEEIAEAEASPAFRGA